jgi:hypothetical protein
MVVLSFVRHHRGSSKALEKSGAFLLLFSSKKALSTKPVDNLLKEEMSRINYRVFPGFLPVCITNKHSV